MPKRITPSGLLALYALTLVIATAVGTTPLAAWLDAKQDSDTIRDIAPPVQSFGDRTGLDRAYRWLHEQIRAAEAARFTPAR
jgi:hypothetical protein